MARAMPCHCVLFFMKRLPACRNPAMRNGVSVLCPSFVATRIYASDRNRGLELTEEEAAEQTAVQEMVAEFFKGATSPDVVADLVFQWLLEQGGVAGIAEVNARKAVKQGQMPARIHKPAIIVLAVKLNK